MKIEEILALPDAAQKIAALQEKSVVVPAWAGNLVKEYDPMRHPVMDTALYPDVTTDKGVEKVTRITLNFQRLAVKRMTELVCGVPVKRVYKPENERQKEIARYLEKIFVRNRVDSLNIDRCNSLFASCEVMTLWYSVEDKNRVYGFDSPIKLRCRNFSPMNGDTLYPLFDEYGDMLAMSVAYSRTVGNKIVNMFDTYTKDKHMKWSNENGGWKEVENEVITLGKIPAVYMYRPTPIWEDTSSNVYEMEWTLSRNGNYLRKNSKPILAVIADEQIRYGNADKKEEENKGRQVVQVPKGSSLQYVTWAQAIESLKYQVETLRSLFFTQLQLPDWSYEKMSQQALSGESRKQLFIDCQLKVKDESGRLLEYFDREMNVVKAFLKLALGGEYAADIDALETEIIITPFSINDEKETIENLITANGGKPVISQREAIEMLGWSDDADKSLEEIHAEDMADIFEPAE
ncbi:MAG: phage portal protein [Bacteroides sp.]|nr:phage portal protein [Bacteroides sp.]